MRLSLIAGNVEPMRNFIKTRKSKAIASMRYGRKDKTLTVEYRNGGRYIYAKVQPNTWRSVKKSETYGGAINTLIKPNHDYLRIN